MLNLRLDDAAQIARQTVQEHEHALCDRVRRCACGSRDPNAALAQPLKDRTLCSRREHVEPIELRSILDYIHERLSELRPGVLRHECDRHASQFVWRDGP